MADNERASQHLPPNDMNFQRNWAASVMVDLLWVAKNYPKIKTAGGKWVGWGKKSKVAHGLGS
jgi:hypothetical protein